MTLVRSKEPAIFIEDPTDIFIQLVTACNTKRTVNISFVNVLSGFALKVTANLKRSDDSSREFIATCEHNNSSMAITFMSRSVSNIILTDDVIFATLSV